MKPRVLIFVGMEENNEDAEPRFYAEIPLTGIDVFVAASDVSVDDLSAEQFMEEFVGVFNMAYLVARQLGIEITIDETVDDYAEETEEGLAKKCHELLKEVS